MEGTIGFEFESAYKSGMLVCQRTLCFLKLTYNPSCFLFMDQQNWKDFITSLAFVKLLEYSQKIILEQMVEPVSFEATISQPEAPKVVSMEAMIFVPTIVRSPRPKKSVTKEKQKKPQPILVRESPRKNPGKVRQKERNGKVKQPEEPCGFGCRRTL